VNVVRRRHGFGSVAIRFAIVSIIPMLALGWLLNTEVRASISARTADVYGSMTNVLFRMAADAIVQPVDFEPDTVALPPERAELVNVLLARLGAPSEQVRVQIAQRSGRVVFANAAAGPASTVPVTGPFSRALRGSPATEFVSQRAEKSARSGGRADHLILLYLPVRFSGSTEVRGVIVASGIDASMVTTINADVRRMNTIVALGLVGLWVALLPIAWSVSRRLRRHSEENEYLALHDTLTGLPNRNLLGLRLAAAFADADRGGTSVGLLLIDLDRFKEVNDTLGHGKGDELLRAVAARLSTCLRDGDTVARLGGDEFAVVVVDVDGAKTLSAVGDRITAALDCATVIDGIGIDVRATIGAALYPLHAGDGEELLRHADIAMYSAKATGQSYTLYRAEIDSHSPSRLALAAEFVRALDRGDELVLHYQPVVSPDSGAPTSMEALVRWQHPSRGLLGPDEFIPMAEQSGLVTRLTSFVLDTALTQVVAWRRSGHNLSVAVNLSACDLRSMSIVGEVLDALKRHSADASWLELEVTETAVLASPDTAVGVVAGFRAAGVRIALDDFGTGYSSLTYLKRLRPDRLKIDRSFVNAMTNDSTDAEIVRALVHLAHKLSMEVTAEGVETAEHVAVLRDLNCQLVQGFWIRRPGPADDIDDWLARTNVDAVAPASRRDLYGDLEAGVEWALG